MCLVSFSKSPHYASLEKLKKFDGAPRWAYITITDRCSHRCPWCYGEFGSRDGHEIQVEEFQQIAAKLKSLSIEQITLSGGEPTEHPRFEEILECVSDFHLHVASHGDRIDPKLASKLSDAGVRQVQINFQGGRNHARIHGHETFLDQTRAISALLGLGIEVVAMVTVGRYNVDSIAEIFREAADLGVTRLRAWETTGRGRGFLGDRDVQTIFAMCAEEAAKLGYNHSLSYEPEFTGDINVPCLQLSNLYMYIDSNCRLRFCGAVEDASEIADFLSDTPDAIMEKYLRLNARISADGLPWCPARDPERFSSLSG